MNRARQDAPILEFDPAPTAVIEPSEHIEPIDIPPHAVLCFFQDVIEKVVAEHGGRVIDHVVSEIGPQPDLRAGHRRAPRWRSCIRASARRSRRGFLEELIARGCRAFVACGGAGVLVPDVALGHVIVPTAAVRDEGTSYHYLPAAREVEPTRAGVRRDRRDARAPSRAARDRARPGRPTASTGRRAGRSSVASRRDASRSRWRPRRSSRSPRSAAWRSGSCSTRATISRATPGTTAAGTSTPAAASCCSGWRPRRAWSSPPDSAGGRVRYPPRMKTANLVTPADIGKRVTFQFELPNGFLSEVVGVLRALRRGCRDLLRPPQDG